MGRVLQAWIGIIGAVVVATGGMGCTISQQETPPLQGPSEFAVSLSITATPEVLSVDGVSQATIRILARDSNGAPMASLTFRAEILVGGQAIFDCGELSTRAPVAGGDGVALLTYTAPAGFCGSDRIDIMVTPTGSLGAESNAQNHVPRTVGIRLVPTGGTVPGAPTVGFKIDGNDANSVPVEPFINVRFDATCTDDADAACARPQFGANIVSYDWSFGDGDGASGPTVLHVYCPGDFAVSLTVTDNNGLASTLVKQLAVAPGTEPTADFVYSPSTVSVGTEVRFNGSISAPDPARTIVDWHWRFGDGGSAHGSQVSHTYKATGAYAVVLTVVDDKRLSGTTSQTINVGSPDPVAQFVFSPSTPGPGTTVNFNASASSAVSGRTIVSYVWDFGDGAPAATGVTTSHSYGAVGTYTVVLTVTDSEGETAVATTTVPVM
jgi:PKD repeat protein